MNHEPNLNDGSINTTQSMTLDEFLFAINLVDQVAERDYNGTLGSVDRTLRLAKTLLNDSSSFWDQWAVEMGSDGMRARAIEFVSQQLPALQEQRPD